MILPKKFYARDAETVARELLGKLLVREIGNKKLVGKIVETEAYYGLNDPASRAFGGKKNMNSVMWHNAGTIFVYMVHNNWLLNVVTGKKDDPQAVLIRAVEPIEGIEIMKKNRGREDNLTNGPGKLTKAFKIDKSFNKKKIYKKETKLYILGNKEKFEIGTSNRIGVSRDLEKHLRFFIRGNKYVSRGGNVHRRKR